MNKKITTHKYWRESNTLGWENTGGCTGGQQKIGWGNLGTSYRSDFSGSTEKPTRESADRVKNWEKRNESADEREDTLR